MNKIVTVIFVALYMTVCITSYSESVQCDLQDNLIRLHIIADSDSERDQNVKLEVRDAILSNVRENIKAKSKNDIISNLESFEKTANDVLIKNGMGYRAYAEYGKFQFPQKTYKSITLPAGEYYGIRVVLGSGGGHNWWCVMYPPLCIDKNGDAQFSGDSEEMLKKNISEDTYEIITQENTEAVIKFKTVEIVQKISGKLKKR